MFLDVIVVGLSVQNFPFKLECKAVSLSKDKNIIRLIILTTVEY